jgi:hypothetical protein
MPVGCTSPLSAGDSDIRDLQYYKGDMPNERLKDAADFIKEADRWIKNVRPHANKSCC